MTYNTVHDRPPQAHYTVNRMLSPIQPRCLAFALAHDLRLIADQIDYGGGLYPTVPSVDD
jgi:hypothetical protein